MARRTVSSEKRTKVLLKDYIHDKYFKYLLKPGSESITLSNVEFGFQFPENFLH